MKKTFAIIMIAVILISACNNNTSTDAGSQATATSGLPTPQVEVTRTPDAESAAQAFLDAWSAGDYAAMYEMISGVSRDAISQEDFVAFYQDSAYNLTLHELNVVVLSALTNPSTAVVAYQVTYHTLLMNEFTRDIQMNLLLENGSWKVQWESGLILPELAGGNHLSLDAQWPARGTIYDRNGDPIAANTDAYALGAVMSDVTEGAEGDVIYNLARLTGRTIQSVNALLDEYYYTEYVPVGEAPASAVDASYDTLSALGGFIMNRYTTRFYYDGGIAPQVIGYVLGIGAEDAAEYRLQGYTGNERVGASGLESWAETQLAGRPNASVYVVNSDGQVVTRLVQTDATPAQDVYTTLDSYLQYVAQHTLEGFSGAIVVMEVDTGRVLAMASSPSIDPNLFDPDNRNNAELLNDLLNDGGQRLLNRATQGQYPLGSVFKIITMAAALESGLYTPETTYDCQYEFNELGGAPLYDWTYTHEIPPSGILNLVQGLMLSCDTYFYHIGLDLYRNAGANVVADMARSFGLGEATGIEQVAESSGNIPDPTSEGDAVQMSIGQGSMLVTPLQVARFISAIANGGTLFRPQVVEQIVGPDGTASFTFQPEVQGTLPISDETMNAIIEGMQAVVQDQRGTAHRAMLGLSVPIFGKTGTATTSLDDPHAWFAGYTVANREDLPDIAVVVVIDHGGEGSTIAAPIFRRMVEAYFGYTSLTLLPWESSLYVTRTPTPLISETPQEEPTATPEP